MPPAVFITARFRTGSTMLWNIFRQIPEVVAYYEPLHEKLSQWIISRVPPQSGHYKVDTYFREYPPVEELHKHHSAEFGVCRLHLEAKEAYPQLKQYIQYLIDSAGTNRIPVFQFNRLDFRLPWVKANFPGISIIHLHRSPRDQWCSSIAEYPRGVEDDLNADPYLITTWTRDLCQQFPFLASPFIRHAYQRHYYLWKLSYLAGRHLANVSVSYEEILESPERTISTLLQVAGLNAWENLERCLAVIVQKPLYTWKQYRSEEWFTELEQECETILTDLGLNQHFGKKPLSEVIADSRDYQRLVTDQRAYIWAICSGQLAAIEQELISEEKEQMIQEKEQKIQELHLVSEEQVYIIHYLQSHPLRRFLKHLLPEHILDIIRRIRTNFQPKLGQLHQYTPIQLNIPTHYSHSTVSSHQSLPVVSIVTPSFNHARFIERTLKSVVTQHYPKLEYIIQDGASTDETNQILQKYSQRLTHVESCKDAGQANAINLGFCHATGAIMAWLNSDDILLPGTAAYIVNFFLGHPDVDVVYGHRIIINEDDEEIGRWILSPHDDKVLPWADYIPQETIFWRRRIWEKAGGHVDESFDFALDWELLLRFREAGATFVRLPRFLAAFRVHPQQKTSQELERRGFQEMSRLRERCHGRHISHKEANDHIRHYMRQQVLYNSLYRLGILKY